MACCVQGCTSNSSTTGVTIYKLPEKAIKHQEILEKFGLNKMPISDLKKLKICSKHFLEGEKAPVFTVQPPEYHHQEVLVDCRSVQEVLMEIPEVIAEYDAPDYIDLGYGLPLFPSCCYPEIAPQSLINAKNGDYCQDHDYLMSPLCPSIELIDNCGDYINDHDYMSLNKPEACSRSTFPYFCNICSIDHLDIYQFNSHLSQHTLNNDVKCRFCENHFLTSHCLNIHLLKHKILCLYCRKSVPRRQLSAHCEPRKRKSNSVEDNEKVYLCIYCTATFMDSFKFQVHVESHIVFFQSHCDYLKFI